MILITNITELKRKYNRIAARLKKADSFFQNCKDQDEIERQMPNLKILLIESQKILNELTALGVKFTPDDVVEGFDIEN